MLKRFHSLLFLALMTALLLVGCGGDDQSSVDGDSLILVDFKGLSTINDRAGTGIPGLPEQEILLHRIDYLEKARVNSVELRRVVRDLYDLSEYQENQLDLDWVRVVHETSFAADDLQLEAFRLRVPGTVADDYRQMQLAYLSGVEALGHGSGQVLEAAVTLGPDNRSVKDLSVAQRQTLRSNLGKARFFLFDADTLFSEIIEATDKEVQEWQVEANSLRFR